MAIQGGAVSVGRSGLRHRRARLFGYFGRGGEAAERMYRAAGAELMLDPMQAAPVAGERGKTAFAFYPLDDRSTQSASRTDGSFLVISGNVYGRHSAADILEDWLRRGVAVFEDLHFHGFVVAWNAQSSEFTLLRDRYGVETGYYAEIDDGILFADDQQILLRFGVDPTIDAAAIDSYLTEDYFPAPLTPYQAIHKLAPGTFVSLANGGTTSGYWTKYLPYDRVAYDDALLQIGPILQRSLERMYPSDGDVGLLLSGGIDSAMVAVGITRMLGAPLRAFTFRYDDYEGAFNEGNAARVVARHLNVPHEDIVVTPGDLIDDLDSAVAAYGEPFNWGLHSYRLSPIAAHGISTVFSGAAADGTGIAKRHRWAYRFNALPGPVRNGARAAIRAARPLHLGSQAKAEWVTRQVDGVGDLYWADSELNRGQRALLYRDPDLAVRGSRRLRSIFREAASQLPPDDELATLFMTKRFAAAEAGNCWNRTFARANGLEMRLPFYDPAYIALGLGVEGADGKDLIRNLALDYLPETVANAPKIPQEMPVGHWLRGPLAEPARERLADLPAAMAEIFDPAEVRSALERHIAGSEELGWRIISLLTLESWYRQQE